MHNVIAPTTGNATNQAMQCGKISAALLNTYKIQLYAGVVDAIPCFLRVHAQIYLDLSDYQVRLAAKFTRLSAMHCNACIGISPRLQGSTISLDCELLQRLADIVLEILASEDDGDWQNLMSENLPNPMTVRQGMASEQ